MKASGRNRMKGQGAARSGGENEVKSTFVLPTETVKALKQAALDQDTTSRELVLKGLKKLGLPVPKGTMRDRRRS